MSIYKDRPATCRIFDCRILAASGFELGDGNANPMMLQAQRWKFSCPARRDEDLFSAVHSAAAFLRKYPECIAPDVRHRDLIPYAVMAVKVYDVFFHSGGLSGDTKKLIRDSETVKNVLKSYTEFEKRMHRNELIHSNHAKATHQRAC